MNSYRSSDDIKLAPELMKLARPEVNAFLALKTTAERDSGIIPAKYRELMSIAVALTTQCAYCIDTHTKNAVEEGATREELAEVVFVALLYLLAQPMAMGCLHYAYS